MFRETLTDKKILEKKLGNGEGDDLGKEHSRQRKSKCKGPEEKGQSRMTEGFGLMQRKDAVAIYRDRKTWKQ